MGPLRVQTFFAFSLALGFSLSSCSPDDDEHHAKQNAPQTGTATARLAAAADWDAPHRAGKQNFLRPGMKPLSEEAAQTLKKGSVLKVETPEAPPAPPSASTVSRLAKTELIAFESAPFPFAGRMPNTNQPFLNVSTSGRRGHRTWGGHVYWENETYNDSRVLLHIPKGFDPKRPAIIILFFHGHGATLARDVRDRQQVAAQVTASGMNAVLVAPQLAVDARDSSVGKLWEPGGIERFMDEAATQLSRLHGDPRTRQSFASMPVMIVAYSGGYVAAATCVSNKAFQKKLRGLVLLDALYGDLDKFTSWISKKNAAFFVSSYAGSTRARHGDLVGMLKSRDVAYNTKLPNALRSGSVNLISTAPGTDHRNFVNRAWTDQPIKDVLQRLAAERRAPERVLTP